MLRFLFFILIPLNINAQIFLGQAAGHATPTPPSEDCGSPTAIGEMIRDDFNGVSLSANWTVRNSGGQTITVSGGRIRFQGGQATKTDSLYMVYTNYLGFANEYSTLSQYTVTLWDVRFNSIGATSFGPICGVEPRANSNDPAALFANVDPSGTDSMSILQSTHQYIIGNRISSASGVPSINTSDSYNLILSMSDGDVTATIVNVTASISKSVTYTYSAITPNPRIPPIFFYAIGVIGGTDYSCDAFTVSSTQLIGGITKLKTFVGNSITKAFCTGNFQNSYPYQLRAHTSCDIQIFAGPGNTSTDAYVNRHEIAAYSADTIFLMLGTNDSPGSGSIPTVLELLVDYLESQGKEVYLLTIVNGGNPATPGTFNANLSVVFNPTDYPNTHVMDVWTGGWNTMSIGNGEMFDALHPTTTGSTKLANQIKAALPGSFPL